MHETNQTLDGSVEVPTDSNKRVDGTLRIKPEFLDSANHALRAPLTAIIGFTGALLMRLPGPLTAEQEKQLTTIRSSANALLSLMNELIDLARIESGSFTLKTEVVDCKTVVDEVSAALRPMAKTKGLAFEVEAMEDGLILHTDRRALAQILRNLTDNGISYTDRGVVHVTARQDWLNNQWLTRIIVSDTGIGIRMEDQAKIFRPFVQMGEGSPQRRGAGLGLHLSQRLAELLGGAIEFKSEFGRGSEFTLVFRQSQREA